LVSAMKFSMLEIDESVTRYLKDSRSFSPTIKKIEVWREIGVAASGKSPAYLHHRKNFKARAGKPAAGFSNRTVTAVGSPLCRRNFGVLYASGRLKGTAMKKLLVAALMAGSFISFEARAGERAGDAALGAVSGAVVLGPVGAVAGALIGYTAGPSIAHSWGIGRSASRSRARRETQAMNGSQESGTRQQAAVKVVSSSPVKNSEAPAGKRPPPVQGFE
jgi:hypothetical protein